MVATDGMKLTLGDIDDDALSDAGPHRRHDLDDLPGARRQPRHVVATWGGTLFNFGAESSAAPVLRAAGRCGSASIAAKAGADVMLSNHTIYDGSKTKLPAVKARKPGERHPYVIGTRLRVRGYLTVVGECAQAAVAIVPAQ